MQRLLLILGICLCTLQLYSQENIGFQKPPKEILDLADYQRTPGVMMDTRKEYMLLSYRPTYKSLNDLNQEEMRLGGLRVNPVTNISSTLNYINNLKIRKINGQEEIQVKDLPDNPQIANISWSVDEKWVAFTNTTESGVELWVIQVSEARAKKLCDAVLNANLGSPYNWHVDNQRLLVKRIPNNRPALKDPKKILPNGPTVSQSDGNKSQNRTYQDLLKTPLDEFNFETLLQSELHFINLSGQQTIFKPKDLYLGESFSPDGQYVMISTLEKPFSYIVPLSRFPQKTTVYDLNGQVVKLVNEVPLTEVMPKGFSAVRKGKRNMAWRSDKPASLYYVEALDSGDPAVKVEYRDQISSWDAPFTQSPAQLIQLPQRFGGIIWGNEQYAIAEDSWYDTRNTRKYLFNPSNPAQAPLVIEDRNSQDVYSDPGEFEMKKNQWGRYTLAMEGTRVFRIGEGFTEKGQFPFIDAYDLKTRKSKRLYQSTYTDKKENLISLEDIEKGLVLITLESKNEFPNYYFRNLKNQSIRPLTQFPNPFAGIENVYKELIKYKRNDGVELNGTLYLPAGYDRNKKEALPLLIWAYPEEYKDKSSAGQQKSNPNEFTFPYYGSFVYWVTRGYAVLDDASFPIIGEGKTEPNDTFIPQLIANAQAAIDAVVQLGYADPKRVAVGGHSYGAFMTANLLTHSNLFACGIARSGAYNRTLTPFGFQSEQRNYWDVPEVYNQMSPFMNAAKMKTPLLLVHGEADNNPGTFTLQTERYFQALKGLGAPVRMVLLPKESHGYAASENIFHLLWEQDQFLEKHLKK
jgi:dipeptidyl aminopeptidase/acylaminoacyl peptidase